MLPRLGVVGLWCWTTWQHVLTWDHQLFSLALWLKAASYLEAHDNPNCMSTYSLLRGLGGLICAGIIGVISTLQVALTLNPKL